MKLVLLSDTHGQHAKVDVPEGDVLIHAGDMAEGESPVGTFDFLEWFALQPHEYKILVAGNHDFWVEKNFGLMKQECYDRGIIYLRDEWTMIDNLKFWGSPWVPNLPTWAFHEKPEHAERRWSMADTDVDVLITHGPPYGIRDRLAEGPSVGCRFLREYVFQYRPFVHVFGHIHEDAGEVMDPSTRFINASILNEDYQLTNRPRVVEL